MSRYGDNMGKTNKKSDKKIVSIDTEQYRINREQYTSLEELEQNATEITETSPTVTVKQRICAVLVIAQDNGVYGLTDREVFTALGYTSQQPVTHPIQKLLEKKLVKRFTASVSVEDKRSGKFSNQPRKLTAYVGDMTISMAREILNVKE